MIEGYRPGPVRVDPVGVAPAEVVAQALRCERLEAALARSENDWMFVFNLAPGVELSYGVRRELAAANLRVIRAALDAALAAAGATGKAGTSVCEDCRGMGCRECGYDGWVAA